MFSELRNEILSPCGKDVDEHPTQCNLHKIVDSNTSGHICGIPVNNYIVQL